jgi:hypothetical protein
MKLFLAAITSAALLAIGTVTYADPAPIIHYAPAENLEHIDVELIDCAQHEIDFAAYGTGLSFKHSHARPIVASKCVFISMPVDCENPRDRRLSKLWPKLRASKSASGKKALPSCTLKATRLTAMCCARAPRTFRLPASSGRTTI